MSANRILLVFFVLFSTAALAAKTKNIRARGASSATSTLNSPKLLTVYFDLALYTRPGVADFTFANFHSFVFLNILPDDVLKFSTDISSSVGSPTFFEADFKLSDSTLLRVGKIWIPFGQMNPHNFFGGRVNVSTLQPPGGMPFLPDYWTDHGIGLQKVLIRTKKVKLNGHLYAINGFGSGGPDPQGQQSYPDFGNKGITELDNNRDKGLGTRLHFNYKKRLGLGVSYYTEVWNDEPEIRNRIHMVGLDTQIRAGRATLRFGGTSIFADLKDGSMRREGGYGEFGWDLSPKGEWHFKVRGGGIQIDNRVEDISDQRLVGGQLLYKPSFYQLSLQYSRDVLSRPGKRGITYIASKLSMAL